MQGPQSSGQLSIFQKMEVMRRLSAYPSLTIMVILRKNLGYRIVNPFHLLVMAIIMFFIAGLAPNTRNPELLVVFAGFTLFSGLCERLLRWKERRRGLQVHSYYIGDSRLECRLIPKFIRRERRLARFIDPLLSIGAGFLVWKFSPALGFWLVFAGLCLRAHEDTVHRDELNRELDTTDAMIMSHYQAATVEQFESGGSSQSQAPPSAIPTGLGDDIQQRIKRRKQTLFTPSTESSSRVSPGRSIDDRLKELDALRRRKRITQAEHDAKKQQILDEL